MPNLKEVRTRIESVKSTQQITNAMKMVAASKLRRAQQAIQALRPYSLKMQEILVNLKSGQPEDSPLPFSEERPEGAILIVAVASNRGLCGTFNTNVIRLVKQLADKDFSNFYVSGQLKIMTAGRHLGDYLQKRNYPVVRRLDHMIDKLTFNQVSDLANGLMQGWQNGEYGRILLVYNQFKNASVQNLIAETYLPLAPLAGGEPEGMDYIFQPDRDTILNEIITKSLHLQLYKAFLDSHASEQGARMTAMHKATDNAGELLKELRLSYNKARQAAITKEILEIVSGANALKEQ
jgi:F-type H+-transporting ATPase subunit gamma